MLRSCISYFLVSGIIQFTLSAALPQLSLAQEWSVRGKQQGILKIVDLGFPSENVRENCNEALLCLDKDNNFEACLAEDWRWIDDRTIEFALRRGVTFHNGEEFSAETIKANWEVYRKMGTPVMAPFLSLPDETLFEIVDRNTVRFTFPGPDGLAEVKFLFFTQIAPAFFDGRKFEERSWGRSPESGPWGTGPFKLAQGSLGFFKSSDQVVLEANERYWDRRYPKVRRVIFENVLIGDRKEAMRLCQETEGTVDIVTHILPLDTLKVAESSFAKVVKSKDETFSRGIFNQRKKDSKWRDIRLRKAINYAVNRGELLKYAAKGNAHNLGGFIPPGAFGHNPHVTLYTYDTIKAKSLVTDAGYPDGFEMEIITYEAWKVEAQIISKMLERIGISVKLEILTHPEWIHRLFVSENLFEKQSWDMAIGYFYNWCGHTAPGFLTFDLLEETRSRWIEYDPVYEAMFKEMVMILDSEVQEVKIRQMVQHLYDRAYFLFIYSPLTLYAVNAEVNFVPQTSGSLLLKQTSVTENHWSVRGKNN